MSLTAVDAVAEADALLAGDLRLPSYPTIHVGREPDWSLDTYGDSWQAYLHNLEYVHVLFDTYERTGRGDYLARATELIAGWVAANIPEGRTRFAWSQRVAGLRAHVIVRAAQHLTEPWLHEALRVHGERLAEPADYAGAWNHGLDQDRALLNVGHQLQRRDWITLAAERAAASVAEIVDEQGCVNEQAVSYHHYEWQLLRRLVDTFTHCGLPVPAVFDRRHRIPAFLAHATRPDGIWEPIGDSNPIPARVIRGTPLEYAATGGQRGTPPAERVRVFDRGWVFGRTGWGTSRPFADESFYSLRFGEPRRIHGHRDHTSLTWYTARRSVITEAGFGGYQKNPHRQYERFETGHNVVAVSGAGPFCADEPTHLADWRDAGAWQSYDLTGEPHPGVTRRRRILFLERPSAVIVVDEIDAADEVVTRQHWHLAPEFADVREDGGHVVARGDGATAHIVQLSRFHGITVKAGETEPMAGWVARGRDDRIPAPVVTTRRRGSACLFVTVLAVGEHVRASRRRHTIRLEVDGLRATVETGGGLLTAR